MFQPSFSGDIHEEFALVNSLFRGANSGIVNIFKIRHTECYRCIVRTRG
jgi:hypothetical protein